MKNLYGFLAMNEDQKAKCAMVYKFNEDFNILSDKIWDVDPAFTGSYVHDYEILNNHLTSR